MTRLYADEIKVERGIVAGAPLSGGPLSGGPPSGASGHGAPAPVEGPASFVWNRRCYVVHAVVEHWVEAGNWWRRTGSGRAGSGVVQGIDDGEREVWRVEASSRRAPGTNAPTGVFELTFYWGAGRWSLTRVHD